MLAKKVTINQYGTCVLPTHEYTFVIESRKGNLCLKVHHCFKSTMIMIFIKILKIFIKMWLFASFSPAFQNPNVSPMHRTYKDADQKIQN